MLFNTQAFADYARNAPSDRARALLVSLATHLHSFVRENKVTQAEWGAAIDALTRAMQFTDDKRNDVTNEVSGTGYTAGGASATLGVSIDTTNDRIEISLGGASWPASTITARGAVYYKSRGGASSADELVAYIDFGANVVSEAGTFALTASTIRIQN